MIKYQLRCAQGHEFEGWFKDSAAFDRQRKRHDIDCPVCGDADVAKAPMAPSIAKGARPPASQQPAQPDSQDADDDAPLISEARAEEVAHKIIEAVTLLRNHVEKECDYVGDKFAEEARRIHYGETDERGIYGEATEEEAEELDDEGIRVFRIPGKPRGNA